MNNTTLRMLKMPRAMRSYVLFLYNVVYESRPENVLEIGVRQAQSTRTILSAMDENNFGLLTSIDIKDYSYRVKEDENQNLQKYWRFFVSDSTKKETVKLVDDKEYDIIFIDGGHDKEIWADFDNYWPLLRKNGLMIFHDVSNHNCLVPKFFDELDIPNKIKFNWGRAANNVIPGLGIVQK